MKGMKGIDMSHVVADETKKWRPVPREQSAQPEQFALVDGQPACTCYVLMYSGEGHHPRCAVRS